MTNDFDAPVDRRGTASLKWLPPPGHEHVPDVIPLWVADMDFACAPAIVEALQKRAHHPVYGYTVRPDGYYEAFISWMARRNHWNIARSWITHAPGVVPALNLAILAYSHPGDGIVIQPPVYYPFMAGIRNNGRRLLENPLIIRDGSYSMDFEQLEAILDNPANRAKMLILCSPHNPVGRVWRSSELAQLADICVARGVVIVSDEIHSDIILGSEPHICTATAAEAAFEWTITLTAPNKTFNIAGLQIANVVIPNPHLRAAYNAQVENLGLGLGNLFGIVAQEAAYRHGESWLDELLVYLKGSEQMVRSFLAERLPRIQAYPLEGTYLMWLYFGDLGLDDRALREFLLTRARIWLDEGTKFGTGGSGFMRLNIACPRARLREALERLEAALIDAGLAR
ncbi:MAG: PatB family C-S lyase [Spirochaetales bacterium]|nr:PatB family C-S lyase [Spirochaetales bacterium]